MKSIKPIENKVKVKDRSLVGMLTDLQSKIGKDAILTPIQKVYSFNFMEQNMQQVYASTLEAR
jgi:hypothetical protein